MTPEARAEVLGKIDALRQPILDAIWELRTSDWPAIGNTYPSRPRTDPDMHRWVFISELEARWPDVPYKILRAALGVLQKDGEIRGCLCGCRGDLELVYHPETGAELGYI